MYTNVQYFMVGANNWLHDDRVRRELEVQRLQALEDAELYGHECIYDPDHGYIMAMESDDAFAARMEAWGVADSEGPVSAVGWDWGEVWEGAP